jgi:hypothetical protein
MVLDKLASRPPYRAAFAIGLASCLVPCSAFAQTKSEPDPPPQTERIPAQAAMELSLEPAFFLGSNAPPHPGLFALFRFAGPVVGFDIGVLTNVGLPGDTIEPLGQSPSMIPASRSQTAAFVFGANFIHYSTELYDREGTHLYFLFPEPDIRLIFSFANVPSSSGTSGGLVVAPGVSLLGLRFTHYIGGRWSWVSEVRAPTAFAYFPVMYGGDTINPYTSLGFSVSTGLAL